MNKDILFAFKDFLETFILFTSKFWVLQDSHLQPLVHLYSPPVVDLQCVNLAKLNCFSQNSYIYISILVKPKGKLSWEIWRVQRKQQSFCNTYNVLYLYLLCLPMKLLQLFCLLGMFGSMTKDPRWKLTSSRLEAPEPTLSQSVLFRIQVHTYRSQLIVFLPTLHPSLWTACPVYFKIQH